MNDYSPVEIPELHTIAQTLRDLAKHYQGDTLSLLALLRMLERVHQEIREGLFQESLPTNRHGLYQLLKDIENQGGWPYIYSRHLRSLLNELVADAIQSAASEGQPSLSSKSGEGSNSHNCDSLTP
jgi:hypothetical protein